MWYRPTVAAVGMVAVFTLSGAVAVAAVNAVPGFHRLAQPTNPATGYPTEDPSDSPNLSPCEAPGLAPCVPPGQTPVVTPGLRLPPGGISLAFS